MLEKNLSKKAKKIFDSMSPDLIAIRKDQGPHSGQTGISDWIVSYYGLTGFIELKVGSNTVTPKQDLFLRKARQAHAFAEVCRTESEILDFLAKIKKLAVKYNIAEG